MKRRWGNEPEVENWIGGTTFISCHAVRPCSIILTAECLRWAAVRLVSAFCVQRKAFLALHHLSLHHLHLKCNSSDFFHDSYIPEDGWTGSRTDVHLCSHIYWALIWNGTARVTNLICHFLHKSETDIAFVLVVQMCRHFALSCQLPTIQRHHRLFKPIKSRRSAWYLTMRWYKTLNYSRRFHKSAFVSESLHSENQGTIQPNSVLLNDSWLWKDKEKEPTKAAGKSDCSQSKHGCEQCRIYSISTDGLSRKKMHSTHFCKDQGLKVFLSSEFRCADTCAGSQPSKLTTRDLFSGRSSFSLQ